MFQVRHKRFIAQRRALCSCLRMSPSSPDNIASVKKTRPPPLIIEIGGLRLPMYHFDRIYGHQQPPALHQHHCSSRPVSLAMRSKWRHSPYHKKRCSGKQKMVHLQPKFTKTDDSEFYQFLTSAELDLNEKLAEREGLYNFHRPHTNFKRKTPYEILSEKLQ